MRSRCGLAMRPGHAIVDDVKRTLGTHWRTEMTNFNQKTVAISFFVFFACIAPAITFGAIYSKFTNYWIGPVEMIVATAWCGILYALIGGQPMMINGGTGPVLAFTAVLFNLSETLDVPFLTLNAWTGIWVGLYMAIAAVFGLNKYILLCTRFTDEIFSTLISVHLPLPPSISAHLPLPYLLRLPCACRTDYASHTCCACCTRCARCTCCACCAYLLHLLYLQHLLSAPAASPRLGSAQVIFIVNALGSPTSDVGLYYYFLEDHDSHDEPRELTKARDI